MLGCGSTRHATMCGLAGRLL